MAPPQPHTSPPPTPSPQHRTHWDPQRVRSRPSDELENTSIARPAAAALVATGKLSSPSAISPLTPQLSGRRCLQDDELCNSGLFRHQESASPSKSDQFDASAGAVDCQFSERSYATAQAELQRRRGGHRRLPSSFRELFQGESAPLSLALFPLGRTDERDTAECMSPAPDGYGPPPMESPRPSPGRAFPWFRIKTSATASPITSAATSPILAQTPAMEEDELIHLDINRALFPHGPTDAFDPASFNDLLMNAQTLVMRLQHAYKTKCDQVRETRSQPSDSQDQLEETTTRAHHLKLQLDDMAAQATEQNRAMQTINGQLLKERQRRKELEDIVQAAPALRLDGAPDPTVPDGRREASYSNSDNASYSTDSGFESGDDGTAESIFSRTITPSSSAGTALTSPAPSTADLRAASAEQDKPISATGVCICQSKAEREIASFVLPILKDENRLLKCRVLELEDAIDGCLDVVSGLCG